MGAPISIILLKYTLAYRRLMIWIGWSICILAILLSSFCTHTLPLIILTQGVMYGLGFVIFYYPILSMVNDYWVTRRGLAYGILCAASGVAGIAIPFALEAMLLRFGMATTLRAAAGMLGVGTGPLLFWLKPRSVIPPRPVPTETQGTTSTDYTFLRHPLFWIYSLSNLLQGLGYFFPSLFLPSYATSLSLPPRSGPLLLALMSIAQVLGQSSFGYLSDKGTTSSRRLTLLSLASTLISAAAMLALWGTARSLAPLCVFAVIYGFFGTGYTALWGRMGMHVTRDGGSAFMAFGLFNAGKGLGNVLAGPISGGLLMDGEGGDAGGGYGVGGRYMAIVLFAGACMAASAASVGVAYWRPGKVEGVRE